MMLTLISVPNAQHQGRRKNERSEGEMAELVSGSRTLVYENLIVRIYENFVCHCRHPVGLREVR